MTTLTIDDFTIETSTHAPDRILPQKAGRALWAPMFAMSVIGFAVGIGPAIVGGGVDPLLAEQWTIWLDAARRFGTILYLFAIILGLVTITTVIRYQSFRIRQVAHTE